MDPSECACICARSWTLYPRFEEKIKNIYIRYFSLKQKLEKLLLSPFAVSRWPRRCRRSRIYHSAVAAAAIVAGSKTKSPLLCVIDGNDIIFPRRSFRNVPSHSSSTGTGSAFCSSDQLGLLKPLFEPVLMIALIRHCSSRERHASII